MLASLLNYGSISTKVRAMESKLLKREHYNQIASMPTVSDFVNYLKNQPAYSQIFASADESHLHRGEIEKYLQLGLYGDYAKIHTFARPAQKKFLKVYFKKYEIQILKTFLRNLFDHRKVELDTTMISESFRRQSDIDYERLMGVSTIDEFFEIIKDSDYYPFLSVLRNANVHTLFDYEFAMDVYFFKHLWKSKNKTLKKHDLDAITRIYGTEIDLLNILWILRSKKYYRVEPEKIYSIIIPISYKLSPELISRLIEAETEEAFIQILGQTYYAKTVKEIDQLEDPERLYKEIMDTNQRKAARKYPYSIAVINHYLYCKEKEINRLTTALECIRYHLDSTEIMKYIV